MIEVAVQAEPGWDDGTDWEKLATEAVAAAIPIVEKMAWGTATAEEIETYNFLDSVVVVEHLGAVGAKFARGSSRPTQRRPQPPSRLCV